MSEWWTYRLSNLLLFSPRTYYRLFELYNAAIWPAQVIAFLLGLVILFCLFRPTAARSRLAAGLLAACWVWVAVAFHAKRYATINFAALQFAWAFGAEAALLAWFSLVRGTLALACHPEESEATEGSSRPSRVISFSPRSSKEHFRAGGARPPHPSPTTRSPEFWVVAYAIFLHPLAGLLAGRDWRGVEVFGVAPDPTAIATIGAILLKARGRRWPLLVVPVLWCVVSGFTLRAMNAPDSWVLFLAAALGLFLAIRKRR